MLRHPILRAAGEFWVVEDTLAPSDAIIILSDDNYSGDRAARAAELYRMGLAPRIVASGKMLRPYAGIAELIQHDLESDGVPASAIVRFPHHADNTREEAEALRTLVAQQGWRRILVVTSNYHTRRSRYIFDRVMPSDVTVRVAAARDSEYVPDVWWEHRHQHQVIFPRDHRSTPWPGGSCGAVLLQPSLSEFPVTLLILNEVKLPTAVVTAKDYRKNVGKAETDLH